MAQDIAEKVALLLAKAEGTDNPHEAEAYSSKAEELMLQYGIDQAMIATRKPGSKVEEIITERVPVSGQYAAALVMFGYAVAPSFDLKAYHSLTTGKGVSAVSYIWLVGHKTDVEQASGLVTSLLVQAEHAMKYWWNTEGKITCAHLGKSKQYASRREFFFAFSSGVRQRLAETRNRVMQDQGTGTELVLRDRAEAVEAWADQNIKTKNSQAGRAAAGDYSARVAGYTAGRDAVGTKKVGA